MRASRSAGFSLIELITVIVILGIVSVIGTQFFVNATESYQVTQTRAQLVNTSRQALERMSREIRGALPYSLRLTNSGACLEFVPIADSGLYRQPVSTSIAATTLETASLPTSANSLVIAALADTEIYTGAPASRAAVTGVTANSINHSAHTWARNSEGMRYYLVDLPRAFCLAGSQLNYYTDIDWSADNVPLASRQSILANGVAAQGSAFTVALETSTNRSLVTFSLRFSEGGESMVLTREVALRNVP